MSTVKLKELIAVAEQLEALSQKGNMAAGASLLKTYSDIKSAATAGSKAVYRLENVE
ncbi:MAG TPA: hypothetical protein VKB19_18770 [Pedobacter sp.]|nr:hypothetical protein [Pedobacter sp.]